MSETKLATKGANIQHINQRAKSMQTYIQECHLAFYNFFRTNGLVSDFLIPDLSPKEREKVSDYRQFMHKGIMEQLKKGRSFKNYLVMVMYIKDYLNAIFPLIDHKKVEDFINYGFKLLAFQVEFFQQLQKAHQAHLVFSEFIHRLPTAQNNKDIQQNYARDQYVVDNILSVQLAMMR